LEKPRVQACVVLASVGRISYFSEQAIDAIRKQFKEAVFKTVIKERTRVAEAAQKNRSIFDMGDAEAAAEFSAVSEELLEALG